MKTTLKRGLILAACMALFCPAAAFAEQTAEETPVFAPITQATDLSQATPTEVVSISLKSTPDNVIFNYEGLTINLVGYSQSGNNLRMDLLINNNTNRTYYINAFDTTLNGMTCESVSSLVAYPNQISSDYMLFSMYGDLQRYMGMDEIADIQLSFSVADYDAYYAAYEAYYEDYYNNDYPDLEDYSTNTNPIKFKDYSARTAALDTGTLLYQGNGIKITKKDLFIRNYGPADLHLVIYIENTGNEDIYISNDSNILNNYSVGTDLEGTLAAGEKGVTQIIIPASELKELNIKSLSNISKFQGTFTIYTGADAESAAYYYNYYGGYDSGTRVKTPLINFLK